MSYRATHRLVRWCFHRPKISVDIVNMWGLYREILRALNKPSLSSNKGGGIAAPIDLGNRLGNTQIETLEPRCLLSAVPLYLGSEELAGDVVESGVVVSAPQHFGEGASLQEQWIGTASGGSLSSSYRVPTTQVVFVDEGVENHEALVAAYLKGAMSRTAHVWKWPV
ncbi:MAG: hypothetical protein AAGA25_15080 [Planctomycetota bacterium]